MKLSGRVKPISYLKANAPKVIRDLARTREPLVITRRGEACAILVDVESYEKTQETLALLQVVAMGEREIDDAKGMSVDEAFAAVRRKRRK